jgi:D-alanyl-lipoteichoic acid acyltransferase DltB (MBOAT superfamily)
MIFTSLSFLVFFVCVFALYWLVPSKRFRLGLLLVASALFYGWWDWRFLSLITLVIVVSWFVALKMTAKPNDRQYQRLWLSFGVVVSLVVLGIFKYTGFFAESFGELLALSGLDPDMPTLRIILPVGVSFYIFQAISYMVDVRRRHLTAEPRLARVALYIAFFPQLVAGPIVRAASFFPQMERNKRLSHRALVVGLRAFVTGLVYKALLADNIGPMVDRVYGDLDAYGNGAVGLATFAFAGQIYFDFAGYSLMAIGIARLFGYHIPRNFNFPYAATSITDFWRRWHMSLSFWLRDYLFIPLGGSRGPKWTYFRNLLATMVLGGLWHGAAWTFVLWGLIHGMALIVHKLWMEQVTPRLQAVRPNKNWVDALVGFAATQFVVLLAWALFRADSLADGISAIGALTGLRTGGLSGVDWALIIVLVPLLLDHVLGVSRWRPNWALLRRPEIWWATAGMMTAVALTIYPLKAAPFVYFQF